MKEPNITFTLTESENMLNAIRDSLQSLFPNISSENFWLGSPFSKLATFVDSHKEN